MINLLIGILFSLAGILIIISAILHYKPETHRKEWQKDDWINHDKFYSWVLWDIKLLHKLLNKSFILTKVLLILIGILILAIGLLGLWIYFG
ncbi:hypothetical protein [Metabacillus litoralis]|uniref:hypothetical protein n=1 Tax=Metabacillus litoralis TaxID=152268 RepID=UPI000EF5F4BB|nr:hypothetical protein [Metabacillus litoralis]